jgi:hypothetical protein
MLKSLLPRLDLNVGLPFHRFADMKNQIPVAGVAHQLRIGDHLLGRTAAASVQGASVP